MQTLIAQTQENKFMYSITMHVVCYLNWMSFEQSVRPQSLLLKHGWMTMSHTMTSPYPTTSYFNCTGIDMGVALLYLFIFHFHAKSCYKVDLLHWGSFQLYHSLHFVCAFTIAHHRLLFLFLIIFVLHSRLLIQQIFIVVFLLVILVLIFVIQIIFYSLMYKISCLFFLWLKLYPLTHISVHQVLHHSLI